MKRIEVAIGQQFGDWTVVEEIEPEVWYGVKGSKFIRKALCRCSCGFLFEVRLCELRNGASTCCLCCSYRKRGHQDLDFLGKRFSKLTVLRRADRTEKGSQPGSYWCCQCDCGNTKIVPASHLLSDYNVKSCGCARYQTGLDSLQWGGYNEISGTRFANIKRNATRRLIEFDLTIEQLWDLFLLQERKCALTNAELYFAVSQKTETSATASLDRIDSTKPYTLGNVQWVHKEINLMKGHLSEDSFLNWCKLVVAHSASIVEE